MTSGLASTISSHLKDASIHPSVFCPSRSDRKKMHFEKGSLAMSAFLFMSINLLNWFRKRVVLDRSPLNLSGVIPSRRRPLSSLFASVRLATLQGSSPVPRGCRGGSSPLAVLEDHTLNDPKGSLSSRSGSRSESISL